MAHRLETASCRLWISTTVWRRRATVSGYGPPSGDGEPPSLDMDLRPPDLPRNDRHLFPVRESLVLPSPGLDYPQAFDRERRALMKRMKKTPARKVVLQREVLRDLDPEEPRRVVGGWFTDTCDSCACVG